MPTHSPSTKTSSSLFGLSELAKLDVDMQMRIVEGAARRDSQIESGWFTSSVWVTAKPVGSARRAASLKALNFWTRVAFWGVERGMGRIV